MDRSDSAEVDDHFVGETPHPLPVTASMRNHIRPGSAHSFSWCCRDGSDPEGRLALLEEEGWQADMRFTGNPGKVEYEIAMPWAGAMVAVSSIRSDEDTCLWPADLSDEARLQLIGVPPPTRVFNTAEWAVLQPAGG